MNAVKKVEASPQSVYAKIAAVQGSLAKHGIGKNRRNNSPGGNYAFRGIDDVYNALAPLLAENGLCVLPRILAREIVERKSAKGNPLFFVTVEAEFDFVSADDGSKHTTRTFGEAMDSSDKATNKAMSAAYKYAAFMTFAIPTEGDNDADATTHEVAPSAREGQSQNGAVSPPANQMPDAEWAKLVQLIEATGTKTGQLLQAYNASDLRELTQEQYSEALKILEKRLADKETENA